MRDLTAKFKSSSQVIGSLASAVHDASNRRSSPSHAAHVLDDKATPGKRNLLEGDFTKSLKQEDENSVHELCSFSSQKFNMTPQGFLDPRYAAAGESKGDSKESRNNANKSSLSSQNLSFNQLANF